MNGHGKSDRRVVPAKPPNKGGQQSALRYGNPYTGTKTETSDTAKGSPTAHRDDAAATAEGVEGRRLAKGNPRQQNAPRTQGRQSAHSALERIRQVARRDRRKRFTTLLHHIYDPNMLREAYFRLKREAAPGVDGQT
jgi:RNA-directed DNA polymerase